MAKEKSRKEKKEKKVQAHASPDGADAAAAQQMMLAQHQMMAMRMMASRGGMMMRPPPLMPPGPMGGSGPSGSQSGAPGGYAATSKPFSRTPRPDAQQTGGVDGHGSGGGGGSDSSSSNSSSSSSSEWPVAQPSDAVQAEAPLLGAEGAAPPLSAETDVPAEAPPTPPHGLEVAVKAPVAMAQASEALAGQADAVEGDGDDMLQPKPKPKPKLGNISFNIQGAKSSIAAAQQKLQAEEAVAAARLKRLNVRDAATQTVRDPERQDGEIVTIWRLRPRGMESFPHFPKPAKRKARGAPTICAAAEAPARKRQRFDVGPPGGTVPVAAGEDLENKGPGGGVAALSK